MIIFITIFAILNIILAKRDASKIEKNIRIDHIFNGGLYLGLIVLLTPLLIWMKFGKLHIFLIIFSVLLIRKIVFDIALNLYRNKQWFWLSSTTTSKIDQIENWLFGYNGKIKYLFYFLLLCTTIITFYIL